MKYSRRFGLLGESLPHSWSPMIHAEFGDYEYKLYEKKPGELSDFFLRGDFDGLNVTIPYKTEVIKFCAGLSEIAKKTGSVNTVTRVDDGSFYGDNTDYFGFDYLLKKIKENVADFPVGKTVILGSGGSSLTVQAVLRDTNANANAKEKAKEIAVISRNSVENNYNNIEKHRDAVMIINATPVGMYPNVGISPLKDLGIFKNCEIVIDLIYNPPRTVLLFQAEKLGMFCVNGLDMLVAQAKKSSEIFTRSRIPDEKINCVARKFSRDGRLDRPQI